MRQLQFEYDTWKRLLGFMMEENIHLKNRLSEVIKDSSNANLLAEMENFQTRFLEEDKFIGILRNELVELGKLMAKEKLPGGHVIEEINNKLKRFRKNLVNTETLLSELKMQFNNYLMESAAR